MNQSAPLGAKPTTASSIVDAYLAPQQSATVSSEMYDQQKQQTMDRLMKLQNKQSYMQRSGMAPPPQI